MVIHGDNIGRIQTKEYRAYRAMLSRCDHPKNKEYARYGGRGISVDSAWRGERGFIQFLADMGRAPTKDLTLDRIDTNGNYCADNCRWATRLEQARNRRVTKTYLGKPLSQWASELGLNYHTLMDRWRLGERDEKLLRPVAPRYHRPLTAELARAIYVDTRPYSVIGREYGVFRDTVYRIKARKLWARATEGLVE